MNVTYPDRRLMRFYLTDAARAALERHATPARNAWPEDAKVVIGPEWNAERLAWAYVVWSSAFEAWPTSVPLRVGNAPEFEGSPIIQAEALREGEGNP